MTLAGQQTAEATGTRPPPPPPSLFVTGSAVLGVLIPLYGVAIWAVMSHGSQPSTAGGGLHFLPQITLNPEPQEQQAYLLLLTAPLILALATSVAQVALRNRKVLWPAAQVAAAGGQVLLLLVVVLSAVAQLHIGHYFSPFAVIAGVFAALATVVALVVPRVVTGLEIASRGVKTGARAAGVAATGVAGTATLVVTVGLYTDQNVGFAPEDTSFHIPFTTEEYAAVVNGATPLVDFSPQYNFLLPYLLSPLFKAAGGVTTTTFTAVMTVFSWAALMAVFAALWMACQKPLISLVGYLAFVALSLYPTVSESDQLHNAVTYYAVIPMRYGLPLMLAPLVVWVSITSRGWPTVVLAVVASATVFNNLDFGLPALGAVIVAMWCQARMRHRHGWTEYGAMAGALAVGILIILVVGHSRTGRWPDFGDMLYFPRQFAVAGLYMFPIPGPFGLYTIMFLTFAGGFALAVLSAVHCSTGSATSPGTGAVALLAYSATLGLGTGTYFVGRSEYHVLTALFCAWGLCLVATMLVLAPQLEEAARWNLGQRLLLVPSIATLTACLVIAISSWPLQTPALQLASRYGRQGAPLFEFTAMRGFLRDCAPEHADVMLIYPTGYQLAARSGVRNWFPYGSPNDLITYEQIDRVKAELAGGKVSQVFTSQHYLSPVARARLFPRGWHVSARRDVGDELMLWEKPRAAETRADPRCLGQVSR